MKINNNFGLDFIVDKLTNSIENAFSGDKFQTEVSILSLKDFKTISKSKEWLFDWKIEMKDPLKEVYKLTIVGNSAIIQGLISLEIKPDHVYVHLLESASFNKGNKKIYHGVPGNLIAFACKLSFQRGFNGVISFLSKSQLVSHYENTLGAFHLKNRIMIIETPQALHLIGKYFPNSI